MIFDLTETTPAFGEPQRELCGSATVPVKYVSGKDRGIDDRGKADAISYYES